jgi:hypothetical protein
VAEWSKAAVLKTAVPATVPGVRIPSPPLARRRTLPNGRALSPALARAAPPFGSQVRPPAGKAARCTRSAPKSALVALARCATAPRLAPRALLPKDCRHEYLVLRPMGAICCLPDNGRRHLCDTRHPVRDSELCERSGATDADRAVHASGILARGETWTRRLGYGALQSIGKGP